jgi:demethylmenaquinone methyltransferase/2-methoxy-6-polyprenyl-1,4-benzoquinol methylase
LEIWRKVVIAIEDSLPLYDQVNNIISLGKAQVARSFALERLDLKDGMCVLDSGIGPGSTSKLILSAIRPGLLVGLDGSVRQLQTAKANLANFSNGTLQVVRGSFEFLPFRDDSFNSITTSYAMRDSLDLSIAIEEYWRVCKPQGSFADVDIGKSDNLLKRGLSVLYIRCVMPLIAKIVIFGRMNGNPWRMIAPTYTTLPTNHILLSQIKQIFHSAELKEFLMGGAIVIIARK